MIEQQCHSTVCQLNPAFYSQYLSLGFASKQVICVFVGHFKGCVWVTGQFLLFAQNNMKVSGSIGGSIHPSMSVKHCVVGTVYSILDCRKGENIV